MSREGGREAARSCGGGGSRGEKETGEEQATRGLILGWRCLDERHGSANITS